MRFIRTKCPNCGKPIQVDSKGLKTVCPYCMNEYDVQLVLNAKKDSPVTENLVVGETYVLSELNDKKKKEKGPEKLGINGIWQSNRLLDYLVISNISEDGKAYSQGLLPGDIIKTIDSYDITSDEDLEHIMNEHYIGEPFVFVINRNGANFSITIHTK